MLVFLVSRQMPSICLVGLCHLTFDQSLCILLKVHERNEIFFEAVMLTANLCTRKPCKLLGRRRKIAVVLNLPWLGSGIRRGLEYTKWY